MESGISWSGGTCFVYFLYMIRQICSNYFLALGSACTSLGPMTSSQESSYLHSSMSCSVPASAGEGTWSTWPGPRSPRVGTGPSRWSLRGSLLRSAETSFWNCSHHCPKTDFHFATFTNIVCNRGGLNWHLPQFDDRLTFHSIWIITHKSLKNEAIKSRKLWWVWLMAGILPWKMFHRRNYQLGTFVKQKNLAIGSVHLFPEAAIYQGLFN